MATAHPTGTVRPLSAERSEFVTMVGSALGNPTLDGLAPLFRQEVEVVEGKQHTWVAATEEDVVKVESKASGQALDLAVRNVGSLAHGSRRDISTYSSTFA